MSYAVIGFGAAGQALARAFARKGLDVTVATRRPPDALAEQAGAIGPTIQPETLEKAVDADVVLLAIPFGGHADVAEARSSWEGKTVVDVTNAFGVDPAQLEDLPSSAFVARGLPGAKLVKGFNHLSAKLLGADPAVHGGKRVVFLASDEEEWAAPVKVLAEQLGFAPVWLGKLTEGGTLVQAKGKSWGPLVFKDLTVFDEEATA